MQPGHKGWHSLLNRGVQCASMCRFMDNYLNIARLRRLQSDSLSLYRVLDSFLEYRLKLHCIHFKKFISKWNDKIILQTGYRK